VAREFELMGQALLWCHALESGRRHEAPTDDQPPQPGSPKSLKLGPPPLVAFRRVYGARAHPACADGANASFGGAELQAIAECGCRHASKLAATRHEPPDRLFDGPSTRRTSPLPAPVQSTFNTRRTVKAATSGLRLSAVKRIARPLATCRSVVLWLTRSQPTEASATIDRGEPAGRPRGGSGADPAQETVSLQAGDVSGLLPQAGIQVGCHFKLLAFGGWDRRNGPRVRGHIADCGGRRRRKAGTATSLGKCPQLPCPRFKFRACRLTVMAIHDRLQFKPMPNNAWLRSR